MKRCFAIAMYAYLLCCLWAGTARAQNFQALEPDLSRIPRVSLPFYMFDNQWNLIRDIQPGDITLLENDASRVVTSVTCAPAGPPPALSVVFTIDRSFSMVGEPILMAKEATNVWLHHFPFDQGECAVTAFNEHSALMVDWTTDSARVYDAVNSIDPTSATSYDAAFLDPNTGCLDVAERGQYRRVIVLLTDGNTDAQVPPGVLARALQSNIRIYVITLLAEANDDMRELALKTGGRCFEYISPGPVIIGLYRQILSELQNVEPCIMEWKTDRDCFATKMVQIGIPRYGLVGQQFIYSVPDSVMPFLNVEPRNVFMGAIPPGSYADTTITLTAVNAPVEISSMTMQNTLYSILSSTAPMPHTLQPGKSMSVRLRFEPKDSAYSYGQLQIQSTGCREGRCYLLGGFAGIPPAQQTLQLAHPNGGEVFPAGETIDLTWSGILLSDTVTLDYSLDSGATWQHITDEATGWTHRWTLPWTESRTCLARATYTADPTVNSRSDQTFSEHTLPVAAVDYTDEGLVMSAGDDGMAWLYGATLEQFDNNSAGLNKIWSIRISPDGLHLLTTDQFNAVLWNISTKQKIQSFTGHADRVYEAAFSSTGDTIVTVSGDGSVRWWDVATGTVLINNDVDDQVVRTVCFDARNQQVVSGHEDGNLRYWTAGTGAPVVAIPADVNMILCVRSHPQGTYIASAHGDGSIKLWSATRPDRLITELKADNGAAHSIDFSPDGTKLAVAYEDGYARVWDIEQRQVLLTLIAHAGPVTSVRFAPNGRYLATGSFDKTVKIWDLNYRQSMRDTSDAVWSIVRPDVEGRDVDFGDVYTGTQKDTLIDPYFHNIGLIDAFVDSVAIRGSQAFAFGLKTKTESFALPMDRPSRNLRLYFRPTAPGSYTAELYMYYRGGVKMYTLLGNGIKTPVIAGRKLIDFGDVELTKYRDTIDVVIRNVSDLPATITKMAVSPNSVYSVEGMPAFPLTLPPGGEHRQTLRFRPEALGGISGLLQLTCEELPFSVTVQLFGRGVARLQPELAPPLNFGNVQCTTGPVQISVDIVNPLPDDDLRIDKIDIAGIHADEFALPVGHTFPIVIGKGATYSLPVVFTPTGTGAKNARLVFHTDAATVENGEFIMRLSGARDTLAFELSKTRIEFDGLRDMQEVAETIGIINTGTVPVHWPLQLPLSLGGFTITEITPNPTPPGATAELHITYRDREGSVYDNPFVFTQTLPGGCPFTLALHLKATVQKRPAASSGSFTAVVCDGSTSATTVTVVNDGPAPVRLTSLSLSGADAQDFSLLTPTAGITLAPGESTEVLVHFAPATAGEKHAVLVVATSAGDTPVSIPLTATREMVELTVPQQPVSFNIQGLNTAGSTTVPIVNTGAVPLTVSAFSSNPVFTVTPVPAVLPPGATGTLTITCTGAAVPGTEKTEITLTEVPCGTKRYFDVSAVIAPVPSALFEVGSAAGAPGDFVSIPVYVRNPQYLAVSDADSFTTTLRFNASLLYPVDGTPEGAVVGNERVIPLSFPVNLADGQPAAVLRFRVALGNDTTTALSPDSVIAVNGRAVTQTLPGRFTLTGVCREGGVRLFDATDAAGIHLPRPHPASGTTDVWYDLIEEGTTALSVVDLLGRTVATPFHATMAPGSYRFPLDVSVLPDGMYFLVLRTPSQVYVQRMDVRR